MELSVLIPTHRRPEKLRACLENLLGQVQASRHEVIVGVDASGDEDLPEEIVERVRLVRFDKIGYIRIRRELMGLARGRVVLWMNDDSYAQAGLLESHLQMHQAPEARVVTGNSAWASVSSPTLFDRLVMRTDLVFFQDPGTGSACEVGYRDCYGLNMSFPRSLAESVGGVPELPDVYGYDDIELAHRMVRAGSACWYTPDARVVHDHRYTSADVHRREYLLGRSAWAYANLSPGFAIETLQADLRDPAELARFEAAICTGWRDALRIERSYLELEQHAPDSIDDRLLPVLAEHWVLLKRLLWRWGVLDAARGIDGRWSFLRETTPDQVLCPVPDPV